MLRSGYLKALVYDHHSACRGLRFNIFPPFLYPSSIHAAASSSWKLSGRILEQNPISSGSVIVKPRRRGLLILVCTHTDLS